MPGWLLWYLAIGSVFGALITFLVKKVCEEDVEKFRKNLRKESGLSIELPASDDSGISMLRMAYRQNPQAVLLGFMFLFMLFWPPLLLSILSGVLYMKVHKNHQ